LKKLNWGQKGGQSTGAEAGGDKADAVRYASLLQRLLD